jgi:hypothetical protein
VPQIDGPSISIAEESAIIVWDPVKKMQHFIRRAAFDTKSPNFGHLVPTPTVPTLAEVEDGIFGKMDRWILPRTVEKTKFKFDPILCCLGGGGSPAPGDAAVGGVRVLGEQKVGGYQTAILEADNTEDLSDWLKKNGYSNDPELQSWLFPYVANQWKITAFKITQDPKTGQLATTQPVRMSFATDKPFFPYREPEVKLEKPEMVNAGNVPRPFHIDEKGEKIWNDARLLRVHFVSTTRMQGNLGNAAWHAKIPWADQLTDEQRKQIAAATGLAENDLPASAWLTTFEDRAEPRPGKDEVYFEPSADRTSIRPPDHIVLNQIWIPIDVVLVGMSILIFFGVMVYRNQTSPWATNRD